MTALNTNAAISIRGVHKKYGRKVHALRGINLDVLPGEVFGLLGPNGAGKSTLIKILMTVIRPTQCAGQMLNHPIGHKPTLARVGYLPEHHSFPPYLSGKQILDFYAALNNVPKAARKKRIPQLLELVGMTGAADRKVKGYSKGMRQRIGIAQALMNDPDIVLLDEPTDGVDPVGRKDIRDVVQRLSEQGKAVFVNSHILSELEMITNRVAILVQGQVATQGTIEELTDSRRRYEIAIAAPKREAQHTTPLPTATQFLPTPEQANHIQHTLAERFGQTSPPTTDPLNTEQPTLALPGDLTATVNGATVTVNNADPHAVAPAIDAIRHAGLTIAAYRPVRPSLEDLFIEAIQKLDGSTDAARQSAPAKGANQ